MDNQWDSRFESALREIVPGLDPQAPILPDTDLPGAGLNSLRIVQLLMRLEQDYTVEFSDDLLTFDTFATPRMVWEALSAAGTAGEVGGGEDQS
ncbi:phosphopantetheine-binding protein [Streptomyces sp. NPDC050619]|uniref:phosphopantetheine-binding protein n=1 Tax=Streptomyces sp. NPDC050619 TaxID=3157214 RepID=UPI00341D9C71